MTYNSLYNTLKQYTRHANRRLRDIERSKLTNVSKAYTYVKQQVYDSMPGYELSQTGKPKFTTPTKKMDYTTLKNMLENVERFLLAKTSTVSRIRKSVSKSYDTFIENARQRGDRTLSKISNEQYNDLFSIANNKLVSMIYGSSEFLRMVEDVGINNINEFTEVVLETARDRDLEQLDLIDIERLRSEMYE